MKRGFVAIFVLAIAAVGIFSFFFLPEMTPNAVYSTALVHDAVETIPEEPPQPKPFVATHIETPDVVKALYMSSWVAATPSLRSKMVAMIDRTEANAIVIDIKDYTGRISYIPSDPKLVEMGSGESRIKDIREFIADLHSRNIYVIGRVAVFQDPYLVKKRPDLAVKTASDKTKVWQDRKKITWIDAGAKDAWQYHVDIGLDAYKQGFDEINYDYIRFPSDGNMKDIYFPFSEGKAKRDVMNEFFAYIGSEMKANGIPSSADLFGMTATNTDDLGIGQVLEGALAHFDFVAPMVYPSHFPKGWNGFESPAAKPYEVIKITMDKAGDRAEAMGLPRTKIRPWLQDFNLGATYTPAMVKAQIKATYDAGLTSWMMWDAANTYTESALLPVIPESVH